MLIVRSVTFDFTSRAWVHLFSGELEKARLGLSKANCLGSEEALSDIKQATLLGEVMMWVVSEMLRAMTGGPSYVPRESVCTQEEPPQQVQVKYEAQRNEEVSTR